jgi:hypothetical protein
MDKTIGIKRESLSTLTFLEFSDIPKLKLLEASDFESFFEPPPPKDSSKDESNQSGVQNAPVEKEKKPY